MTLCWSSGFLEKCNRKEVSCVLQFLVGQEHWGQMSSQSPWQFTRRSLISVQGKLGWAGQPLLRGPRGLPCMFIMVSAHAHGLPPLCRVWRVVYQRTGWAWLSWQLHIQSAQGTLALCTDKCTFGLTKSCSHICPSTPIVTVSSCGIQWWPDAGVAAMHADWRAAVLFIGKRKDWACSLHSWVVWGRGTRPGSAWGRWDQTQPCVVFRP